jgi:hypothetical protein
VEISKIQVPLIVEARTFMRVAKKRTMFVIYATLIMESVNGHEDLPICYKEYQDIL